MGNYHELSGVNKALISGYNIKAQNYNEGIETMKRINHIIQKASRLRGAKDNQSTTDYQKYYLFFLVFSWTTFGSYD